ncbi:Dyp-type peroxidase [Nocardioides sp.]|uniref:Dyp-type peroxidase n=1 Tax=Nocardioides sp. TaxID=35761 RepID=UPI0037844FB0
MPDAPRRWGRRQLLQTGAVALGGAGVGWTAATVVQPTADASPPASAGVGVPPGNQTVPFHGLHQAGVTTPPQAHLSLLGIDLSPATGTEAVGRLMSLISDDAARLTRAAPALADTEPELAAHPARLTVTFGFGPRLLPDHVAPLPAFSTDALEPAWGQTDLAVQVCSDDPLAVAHARRMISKDLAGFGRVRWIQDGFRYARGTVPDGTSTRNVLGQVDGTANPQETDADFDGLIWSDRPGFEGGTVMVVRRIRARMAAWDRVDRSGREAVIGRRLDNGAPLTGNAEHDQPDFAAKDPLGFPVIDPASHVARAHSRDSRERFLRRPYNYTVPDPTQPTGEDSGLVFIAFAADVDRQFVPVQRRLAELDRLNQWVTTIGSAVYAVPPGAAEGKYVGQRLLGS